MSCEILLFPAVLCASPTLHFLGRRERTPTPKTRFSIWTLLRTLGPFTTRPSLGHTLSTAGTCRNKFWKNSGKTPETLSERFLEFPSKVRLGSPKPYNSRHLRLPSISKIISPFSTAGDASFLRIGSGEGFSEPLMEFLAVLKVFLRVRHSPDYRCPEQPLAFFYIESGVTPANQTKERPVHELFSGAFRNKSSM